MTNIEKINQFLDEAKTFYFLTVDGNSPKGRPFGFHLLDGDKLYFGCGTFKKVFSQLTKNPNVEILAMRNGEFMRYDGTVKIVDDDEIMKKARAALPQVIEFYNKNGWELGLFYLQNGHIEIRGSHELKEEFDV